MYEEAAFIPAPKLWNFSGEITSVLYDNQDNRYHVNLMRAVLTSHCQYHLTT